MERVVRLVNEIRLLNPPCRREGGAAVAISVFEDAAYLDAGQGEDHAIYLNTLSLEIQEVVWFDGQGYDGSISMDGAAFDFRWRNSSGTVQSGRVIFVPMAAGLVEFSLVTTEEKTSAGQELFHRFLLTFRTDVSGKLEVVHFAEYV